MYDDGNVDELELAYCISVHKSQGSEFPVVIMPVMPGPRMLTARNLLYTAVTRARKCVVLVGRDSVVNDMIANNYVSHRYSALSARIRAYCAAMPSGDEDRERERQMREMQMEIDLDSLETADEDDFAQEDE